MRASAGNAHISFVVTGSPRERFGEGLGCIDVLVLQLALLFLDFGVKFRSLLWDPRPGKDQGELRHLTV